MKYNELVDRQARRLLNHTRQLQALGYTGVNLTPIRKLEARAHKAIESEANGELSEKELRRELTIVTALVEFWFGGKLPQGFYINEDPRGHALKLKQDYEVLHEGERVALVEDADDGFHWILDNQGQSYDYATTYGGYEVRKTAENDKPLTERDWGNYGIFAPCDL